MNPGVLASGAVAAFLVAGALTWAVLRAATRWGVLDQPNERSSHQRPTPTLGGLGIVVGTWAGVGVMLGLAGQALLAPEVLWGLGLATLVLLGITWDDVGRPLGAGEKLLLQLAAVGAWLWWAPRLEWVTLPGLGRVELGGWSWPVTVVWFVGLGNVCNFMDGIDGLSGVEAISVGGWLALCLAHLGSPLAGLALAAAAGAAGFLLFNFPPARIFMGDVGVFFMGFWWAVLGVLGERAGMPLWLGAALLGCYLFDTGYTLVRRARRGENLLKAHRRHLYQRLTNLGWTHLQVDLGVLLLDLLLGAGVWAWLSGRPRLGGAALALAAGVLVAGTAWIEREEHSFG